MMQDGALCCFQASSIPDKKRDYTMGSSSRAFRPTPRGETVAEQATTMLAAALHQVEQVRGIDASDIDSLRAWCADPRPPVSQRTNGAGDKFADFITICRRIPDCSPFFMKQLELNPSTLWRWSMGQSKPTSYVAASVVADLVDIIRKRIDDEAQRR